MPKNVRIFARDDREFLLDLIDTRWYLFEVIEDGDELIGSITERGDSFLVECFWRPRPDATAAAESIDDSVVQLLEMADAQATLLADAQPERDITPFLKGTG